MEANHGRPRVSLTARVCRLRWVVTQIGSREHYGVPRAFHGRGCLEHFYTDIWWRSGAGLVRRLPGGIAALATRGHRDLPPHKVTAFNFWSARNSLNNLLRRGPRSRTREFEEFARIGGEFALRVNRHLLRSRFDPRDAAAFLYTTGALETCELMRQWGVPVVVDQIDPARVEEQLVAAEMQKWPGWQDRPGEIPESYFQRLTAEWRAADVVLVNSNWSRTALMQQGIDQGKIVVVPLCLGQKSLPAQAERATSSTAPLTVLWLGQVNLRKGIPYLFEAARQLLSTNVRFIVAGPVGISAEKLATAPGNVSIVGRILKADTPKYYAQADLFVLPTVSDGFAITQLEAMSSGLPVITTPNCGDVVTHGTDGLIVPPCNSDALAQAILSLDRNRELLHEMSIQAMQKPKERRFSLDGYADAVENAVKALPRGSRVG